MHSKRWIFLSLGIAALLIIFSFALFWLSRPRGEAFLAARIEAILSSALSQPVKLEKLETDLFSRVEITGFRILSIDSIGVPVVDIPYLRIKYNLPKILISGLEIDSLIVSSLHIKLGRDSLGTFDLNLLNTTAKTESKKPSDSPQQLKIKYIALQSGDCIINDRVVKLGGTLKGLSAVIHMHDLDHVDFTASAGSVEFESQTETLPLGELRLSGNWTSPLLTLDSLSLWSSDVDVAAKGSVRFVKPSPLFSTEFQISGYLPVLIDSLNASGGPPLLQGEGILELNLIATGSFDEPIVELDATINELRWDQVLAEALSLHLSVSKSSGVWFAGSNTRLNVLTDADKIYHPVTISSMIMFADSMIGVSDFLFTAPEFTIQGGARLRTVADNMSVNADIRLKGSISNAADIVAEFSSPMVRNIEGAVDLALNCEGSIHQPAFRLSGKIPVLRLGKAEITNVEVMSEYSAGKILLTQFAGNGSKGEFSLNGDLETATLLHHLALTITDVDLHGMMSASGERNDGYEGFLNANVSSSGKLSDPSGCEIMARVSLDTIEFADTVVPAIVAELQCDKGRVSLLVTQNDTLIEAGGSLTRDSLDCRFSLSLPEIRHFAVLFNFNDISGAVDAKGSVTGTYADPSAQLDIKGTGCSYWSLPVDTLRGRFVRSHGQYGFENVTVVGEASEIDSTSPPFGVSGIAGGFSYRCTLSGPVNDPDIGLTLLLKKFSYRNIPIQSGIFPLSFANHRISLIDADIESDSLHILGRGDYSFDSTSGSVRLTFVSPEAEIDSLPSETGRLDVNLIQYKRQPVMVVSGRSIPIGALSKLAGRSDIDGRLDIVGAARLGAGSRIDSLEIRVRDLTLSKAHLDSLVLKGRMSDREIIVSALDGFANGVAFQSKASLSRIPGKPSTGWFNPENRLDAAINGSKLDFALVQPFLPEGFTAAGDCELNLNLTGNLGRPKVEGYLKLRKGRLGAKDEVLLLDSLQGDLSVNDTLLIVEELSGKYKGIEISANAELLFRSADRFEVKTDVSVNGEEALRSEGAVREDSLSATVKLRSFDLSLIQPMVPHIDALGGIADGDIRISGAMKHPVFKGQLIIERMFVSPSFLEDTLSNCSLDVGFDNHEIALHHFGGLIGGGILTASGSYLFAEDSVGPRLHLHMADVHLRGTREYNLVIKQVDLSVRQSDKKSLIEGDIVLGESHFRSRYTPKTLINMFRKSERPRQAQSEFLSQMRVDVRVRDSEEIWIDNNLARLKLRADVALLGEITRPVVSGRITTIEGYVLYLDRKFNVEYGMLDFYDPHKINPNIELLAVTTVKGYNSRTDSLHIISLSITGEIDKAEVTLTSDPPEDLSDIISLLTLGITRRDLTGVDGKERDVKLEEAVRERLELITSRRLSGYLSSNVENYMGLTSFSIENNLFQFDKNWGPQLIASKKLSSRAVLTYTTTVGRINEQGIKLAYKLTERFAVEGETDQIGRSGIDLIYKLKLP